MDPPDIKMTQILKDRIKMATDLENTIHRYEKGIRHQKWEDKIIRAFDLEEDQSPRNWMDDNSENDAGHDTAAKRQIEKMKKRLKESFLIPLSPQYLLSSSIHNRKQTSLRYPH
ncbi:uncharacterized protein LOC135922215 [Gordionus sp. m RMFG-2023]|uniref:uncharacterized protein LOC135922215 n=1 Tax=Gordionus sp. m RMFG-2023 TaxID=3053472 RepID=UPI0031FD9A62